MVKELMLWLKEKLMAVGMFIGAKVSILWRWFAGWLRTISGGTWRKVALAVPLAFVLYILIGMPIAHRVNDDMAPAVTPPGGGAQAVALASYLIKREAADNNWTPNDPFLLPGWWIDNTPAFQKGILGAVSRFTIELRDQLGRSRGSSADDPDLKEAAGKLAIEPERWVIDFSTSWLPTSSSDSFYRDAIKNLDRYNRRVAAGEAVYERRADNLRATLERIASDLGASSAALERYISVEAGGFLPDFGADDLFYETKGQIYAYTLLLKSLRVDFSRVIEDRELAKIYDELLRSLEAAARLDPTIVTNGAIDGMLANHLSIQGFYLLRARTQLKEVTNILLN